MEDQAVVAADAVHDGRRPRLGPAKMRRLRQLLEELNAGLDR
jgi:hypothetical protein